MFMIKVGKILAFVAIAIGLVRALAGVVVSVVADDAAANAAMSAKYLGAANSNDAIKIGLFYMFVAVGIGLLTAVAAVVAKSVGSKTDD
jgi:hypothetical protein